MEDKLKNVVCQMQEVELAFVQMEMEHVQTDGLEKQQDGKLPGVFEKYLRRRRNMRALVSAAAVVTVVLMAANFQEIAQGAQRAAVWVQEKVNGWLMQEESEPYIEDTQEFATETGTETHQGETDTAYQAATEAESGTELETGEESVYSGRTMYDADAQIVQDNLCLYGTGNVCIVRFAGEHKNSFVMCAQEDGKFLFEIPAHVRWETDTMYQRFYGWLKDCNGDGRQDLLVAEVYSAADGKTQIVGEQFLGSADGFVSAETFSYDTGLVLGFEPASFASGYEQDLLSVSWEKGRISLWYEDTDAVRDEENHNFYAWCDDISGVWETVFVEDSLRETAGMDTPAAAVWHRDFADGTTIVVRDAGEPQKDAVIRIARTDGMHAIDNSNTRIMQTPPIDERYMSACYFASPDEGYLAYSYRGNEDIEGHSAEYPLLYETQNCGASWEFKDLGIAGDVYDEDGASVSIWDAVYAYGEVRGIWETQDGICTGVILRRMEEKNGRWNDYFDRLLYHPLTFEELTGQ